MKKIIDYNKIYSSKNYGNFIIKQEINSRYNHRRVLIKFLETNSELEVSLENALIGNVKDPNRTAIYHTGEIIKSKNYGDIYIVKDFGFNKNNIRIVHIKFLNTGSERIVSWNAVKKDKIKDLFKPSIYGVGYIATEDYLDPIDKMLYHRWINMLSRCYNPNDNRFNSYGNIGIKVDNRWHSYDNYRNDIKNMHGFNLLNSYPNLYHIDKDYLQLTRPIHKRIYSNDSCIILLYKDNLSLSNIVSEFFEVVQINELFYTKIFNPNDCSLITLGPFDNKYTAHINLFRFPIHNSILNKLSRLSSTTI